MVRAMLIPISQGSKVDGFSSHTIAKFPVNTYVKDRKMRTIGGLSLFSDLKGMDRNGFFINTEQNLGHFRVIGDQLISFDEFGTQDYINPDFLIAGKDRAKFDATIQNLIFVAGGKYYLYNATDGVRECQYISTRASASDPWKPDPTQPLGEVLDVTYIKQTVVLLVLADIPNTSPPKKGVFMQQSNAQADDTFIGRWEIDDTDPDRSVSLETETDFLILFNKKTITFWYAKLTDPSQFAFLPAESKEIEGGILQRDHKARLLNTWAVLSITVPNQEPNIYLLGTTLQPLGTIEIQNIIKRYSEKDLTLAMLESYQQDGIEMLLVHLPFDTLLYNASDNLWSVLKSRNDDFESVEYRAINMVRDERTNEFIVGDRYDEKLGVLDQRTGTEYGLPICQVIYGPYQPWNLLLRHLVINGNFGDWPEDEQPLIRMQLTKGGLVYGQTLPLKLPAGRHYNSLLSTRGLGRLSGMAGIRLQIDTKHKLEFDDVLYVNEDADAMVGL